MSKFLLTALIIAGQIGFAGAQDCQPFWTAVPGFPSAVYSISEFDDGGGAALWVGRENDLARVREGVVTPVLSARAWRLRVVDFNGSRNLYACTDHGLYRLSAGVWSRLSTTWVWDVAAADLGDGAALYLAHFGQVVRLGTGVIGTFLPADCGPTCLAVFPDSSGQPQLYFGGYFTRRSNDAEQYRAIARWDGASWHSVGDGVSSSVFVCGSGPQGGISSLLVFDDGSGAKLYAGGGFDLAGSTPVQACAVWDGSRWSAVGPIGATTAWVGELIARDEAEGPAMYACGSFDGFGGSAASGIARWDGVVWSAPFPDVRSFGTMLGVVRIAGDWYLAGEGFNAGTVDRVGLARLGCICPDLDGSGTVDLADLAMLLATYGGTDSAGDVDSDRRVDLGDLSLMLIHFGQSCP